MTTTLIPEWIASVPHYCCYMQAPYCHVVLVVTSFLTGRCSVRISRLLSDLQPLECHVFCSQPEIMHSQWVPMPGGQEEEEEEGSFGTYSHYGEFQALMRKWINREVSAYLYTSCEACSLQPSVHHYLHFGPLVLLLLLLLLLPITHLSPLLLLLFSLVWCSCVGDLSVTVPL